MKILVIDDNKLNRMSAEQTLKGHEVKIVGTYDKAYELLREMRADAVAVIAELTRRGFKHPHDQDATEEERQASKEEKKKLEDELRPQPPFDAVLCDLLMPASAMTMGPKGMQFVGKEMAVGFGLALMAALQGAKYIAVATATNHHDHPAVAMFDSFGSVPYRREFGRGTAPRFTINGARVGYYEAPGVFVEGTTCKDCDGTGGKERSCHCIERNAGVVRPDCDSCNGTGRRCWTCRNSGKARGKDWGSLLDLLVE